MTMVELPPGAGYSGAFVRGPRSAGESNAVEEAGAVIVKRAFTIAGGALAPDPSGEAINFTDTIKVVGSTPWVTVENDLAVAKRHGDLIVLGGKAAGRGGAAAIGATTWLARSDPAGTDVDLAENLFGWHPRAGSARLNDARMVNGQASAASDRYDRFQNAQRRAIAPVSVSHAGALPAQATVRITHSRIAPETEDPVLLTFSYAMPALSLTLLVHEGRGPDRDTRWCPHVQGAMTFDTMVVRPATGRVAAVWRRSWRWGSPGAETLRRAVVSEGAS